MDEERTSPGAARRDEPTSFTLTVTASGVRLLDHADGGRYRFGTLLDALAHMEMVMQFRQGRPPGPLPG